MLTQQEIKNIFVKSKAIITDDHFVYAKKETGWFHGPDYVNKDMIYLYTRIISPLCLEIANLCWYIKPQVVVGPTIGAVSLSQWTAHWLALHKHQSEVLAVYADEEDVFEKKELLFLSSGEFSANGLVKIVNKTDSFGSFGLKIKVMFSTKVGTRRVIKRGYDEHVKGAKCLIVEDVINSGDTVAKTRDAVLRAGGEVVGVGALCNRSGGKVTAETLGVPKLFSLLNMDMQIFPEDECPICKKRGPGSVRTDLGKGKDFLVRKGLGQFCL